METPKKNKGGRPRKYDLPLVTYGMKIQKELLEFLKMQENTNRYINEILTNTPEFKAFLAKREAEQHKDQPSLFKEE